MKIIARQVFCECVCKIVSGVYLPHLHKIVGNMLPNKMVDKRHNFPDQGANMICRIQHHTHIVYKYRCRFGYFYLH